MDAAEALLRKLERQAQIRYIIVNRFVADQNAKIRKGIVQEIVAEQMGSKHSKILCREVIDTLESMGVKSIAVDGLFYFKGIALLS